MNNLIQAITDYTTTLEQKLSALEARVALLETESGKLKTENEAMKQEGDEARSLIAALQAEVATLATAGAVAAQTAEPEVEIELIVEEEPQEEVKEELEKQETIEPIESLESLDEVEVVEPVAEPAPAPQPEAKAEPVAEPTQPLHNATQPLHNATQPLQTSLFGTAVEDIRQAISLGDRFLFQRELFAGNGELMQKTLDEINGLGSLSEAMDYVRNNFDWDKESTAVQLFENVLKRRFS